MVGHARGLDDPPHHPPRRRISGHNGKEEDGVSYLYRCIAGRSFERRFQLADHIKVSGANLVNGLLHVDLVREVPEEMRPRKIAIATRRPAKTKAIEKKAA